MVNTYRNIEVTISGNSDEDIRNQAKNYFGFQEPEVQKNVYHVSKLQLVKMLRAFDVKYNPQYNVHTGLYDGNSVGLMDTKKFVEEYLGEPT